MRPPVEWIPSPNFTAVSPDRAITCIVLHARLRGVAVVLCTLPHASLLNDRIRERAVEETVLPGRQDEEESCSHSQTPPGAVSIE